MKLILARHGNTFAPGDRVVWTGKSNDLPLVDRGMEQAKEVAGAIKTNKINLSAVYCSTLERTKKFAEIIKKQLQLKNRPIIDSRLDEIDYGRWSGLSSDQVIAGFGQTALDEWNNGSIWPENGGWGGSEGQVFSDAINFASNVIGAHQEGDTVLIISSNGILRYFLKLIPHEFEKRIENGTFKVKTGHLCRLDYRDALFSLAYWNVAPGEISK